MQKILPFSAWADPPLARLPGILPLDPAAWLVVDEAYGGQMALREALIEARRDQVLRLDEGARPAAAELLERVLAQVAALPGFHVDRAAGVAVCPDGRQVAIQASDPLGTVGRLVQEDFCLMERRGGQDVLTGAVLCFPASWTLSEKFLRPLEMIHRPVGEYDANIARRVQRLFDAIRPERPLWRANAHLYENPALFAPRREGDARPPARAPQYLRSERQCLLRLPESGAVVFSIHTYMVRIDDLTPAQKDTLDRLGR